MDLSAETVEMVFVVIMRFEIGVDGEEAEDISSTSKWPLELTIPFVVIEILRPAVFHSVRRPGRCRRSDVGGGFGEFAKAWAKSRPRFPTPRTWIRRESDIASSMLREVREVENSFSP